MLIVAPGSREKFTPSAAIAGIIVTLAPDRVPVRDHIIAVYLLRGKPSISFCALSQPWKRRSAPSYDFIFRVRLNIDTTLATRKANSAVHQPAIEYSIPPRAIRLPRRYRCRYATHAELFRITTTNTGVNHNSEKRRDAVGREVKNPDG